ncbi:MAG: divergent PAP2 family protein [Dehalococcoidales bacterium]|jgi:acid phosphatase family membrane protein YuiD|nr:divergent PAP2 family protein [Dehalococcoidales bacterium]
MFDDIITNKALVIPICAWALAQISKVFVVLVQKKRFDVRYFVISGGMPSSHSAFVSALATTVAFIEGLDSVLFGMCVVLALVVMYDAAGVRQAVGQQAVVLNRIIKELETRTPPKVLGKEFKELVGHTSFQVLIGGLMGIGTAWLWIYLTGI